MSTPTSVDSAAPVIARHNITINAQPDVVWALHTDVHAWPTWQTDITAAHIEGPFSVGASFSWTSFGFSVTSTIYALVEHTRVLWGGTADGITGIHEWRPGLGRYHSPRRATRSTRIDNPVLVMPLGDYHSPYAPTWYALASREGKQRRLARKRFRTLYRVRPLVVILFDLDAGCVTPLLSRPAARNSI